MTEARPVGFFDSGFGGTCILNAFRRVCPLEKTIYLADSANCPYGNKTREEIMALSFRNAKWLIDRGSKAIVVACNTATAAAIDFLRDKFSGVPFVGLEPAVKPAALRSRTGIVAVLATRGTFDGRLYKETKAKFASGVKVIGEVADDFVTEVEKLFAPFAARLPCNENGAFVLEDESVPKIDFSKIEMRERIRIEDIIRHKIEPLVNAGVDHIVLGCTHFPHLKTLIQAVARDGVSIIDPSQAVANRIQKVINQ